MRIKMNFYSHDKWLALVMKPKISLLLAILMLMKRSNFMLSCWQFEPEKNVFNLKAISLN